ncbi:hypothetical protein [Ectobacillus funiculus]|uniref:hypothetical protein n=1 Tax=Ectobacillus funiculus TaxID=137993 RepID=UPI00101C8B36|nr:hypothetical protein [Ectobacillus funiculus]
MDKLHDFLNVLDPNDALEPKDWIALSTLLFTILTFIITQSLNARSQRVTRQLAVRPYFSITRLKRNINLSTAEKGIEEGSLLLTKHYKKLSISKEVNPSIKDIQYLKVNNLGPSFALDCNFEIKCTIKKENKNENWVIKNYKSVINKDECIYIPLDSPEHYPAEITVEEMKLTFQTQFNEKLVMKETPVQKDKAEREIVIYKKKWWGLFNEKIMKFSSDNTSKGLVIE